MKRDPWAAKSPRKPLVIDLRLNGRAHVSKADREAASKARQRVHAAGKRVAW